MPSWRYLIKYLRDAAYAGRYGPPYITLSLPVIGRHNCHDLLKVGCP